MTGSPRDQASALAKETPTSSEPTRPGPWVTAMAPMSSSDVPASARAFSTTPQMSRTCWRDASSGTTPPHSRWIAICEATTFDDSDHGRAAITGFGDHRGRRFVAGRFQCEEVQRLGSAGLRGALGAKAFCRDSVYGAREDAALGDDARDIAVRGDVEGGVADLRADRRQPRRAQMRHFPLVAFLDRDLITIRRGEVDRRQRGRDVETASCARARAPRPCRFRSCWQCHRWRRCDRPRRRRCRSPRHA